MKNSLDSKKMLSLFSSLYITKTKLIRVFFELKFIGNVERIAEDYVVRAI